MPVSAGKAAFAGGLPWRRLIARLPRPSVAEGRAGAGWFAGEAWAAASCGMRTTALSQDVSGLGPG
ncbi:MAG TPA: hypothetical protein VMW75_16285, partial [Thermoanaerobaculia bacterium]|nr:hypothetical protein [Thermoanaerobaculia bacterium]